MITEIDVPRPMLKGFLNEVREDFRKNRIELIYGTVRLIERDDESFLPWAKQPYACTIFNLHTVHSPEGLQRSEDAFRRLIDMAGRRGDRAGRPRRRELLGSPDPLSWVSPVVVRFLGTAIVDTL